MKVNTVVFDFGGVLVDWNPRHLYRKMFSGNEEQISAFLETIGFEEMNARVDRGESLDSVTQEYERRFPEYREPIAAFRTRYPETFNGELSQSVQILADLKALQVPLYGLTNWGKDAFARMRSHFPFFEWFNGIVVSGEERVSKPEEEIYKILISRYSLNPRSALFIDDREVNLKAAEKLGLQIHHFQQAEALRERLRTEKLLM